SPTHFERGLPGPDRPAARGTARSKAPRSPREEGGRIAAMATTTLSPTGPAATLTSSTRVVAKRAALRYLRTPQIMVLGTIQGVMFLLIFRYVFGGAIGSGGLSYVNFLVPCLITTGILFTGMGAATAVAEDLEQGFVDRLR